MRTYSELIKRSDFRDRFEYLKLDGKIGEDTFGFDRYLNQIFYRLPEWRHVRDLVIVRDNGNDLGLDGFKIYGKVLIHHMNPITYHDIIHREETIMDPEFLICVSQRTHNAIHYGNETLLPEEPAERTANDTCPWRH